MRLDVGLMDRLGCVPALDDHLSLFETVLHLTLVEIDPLGDVRRLGRLRFYVRGEQVVVQDRRVVRHRRLNVDNVRQHLVLHVDQFDRLSAIAWTNCRNRGYGVALIQCLAARHAVA